MSKPETVSIAYAVNGVWSPKNEISIYEWMQ